MTVPSDPLIAISRVVNLLELIIYCSKLIRLSALFSRMGRVAYLEHELRRCQKAMKELRPGMKQLGEIQNEDAFARAQELLPRAQLEIAELKIQILENPSWQNYLPPLPPLSGEISEAEGTLIDLNREIARSSIPQKADGSHISAAVVVYGQSSRIGITHHDYQALTETDIDHDDRSVMEDFELDSKSLVNDFLTLFDMEFDRFLERRHHMELGVPWYLRKCATAQKRT